MANTTEVIWRPQPRQKVVLTCPYDEILYGGAAGAGKALDVNTDILTTSGYVKMGSIEPGMNVYAIDGSYATVVAVSPVMLNHDVYRVTFDDGSWIDADADHIWFTHTESDRAALHRRTDEFRSKRRESRDLRGTGKRPDLSLRNSQSPKISNKPIGSNKTTLELLDTLFSKRGALNHSIPIPSAYMGTYQTLPIHPYVLGLWLGDGNSHGGGITCADVEIIREIESLGYGVAKWGGKYAYGIYDIMTKLRDMGLLNNKHIPNNYLLGTESQRLALLQGLMDSDGSCTRACEFCNTNELLATQVLELVRGLGIKATINRHESWLRGKRCLDRFRVTFTTDKPVFRLPRKLERIPKTLRSTQKWRFITGIEKIESVPVKCIAIDHPSKLYLASKSFIPTHNTDMLIGDWLQHNQLYGTHTSGVLFRNSFPELMEIQQRMQIIYGALGAKWKEKDMTWTMPNGGRLRLAYLDSFDDALKHRGFQYDWQGYDELTMRATDEEYVFLDSRMRNAKGVPLRKLSTSNPGGPGHNWVLKRFQIDKFPNGMVPIHEYLDVKNNYALTPEEGCEYNHLKKSELPEHIKRKTRIFIPGRLSDNRFLDQDGAYRAHLLSLPEAQRRMMLDGRWDIVEGTFFDEWDPNYHVVKAFNPPSDWKRWMSGDWGTSKPYAFLWFCQSPQGEVYVYRELYGAREDKDNEGVREAPSLVAKKIKEIELEGDEWISERYLDASCFDNHEMGTSVSEQFRAHGVVFQPSQKKFKSGSIAMVRDYLKVVNGYCRLKFMDSCIHSIRTIPRLQIDRKNVEQYDSSGDDHLADSLCYGLRRNIKTLEELNEARGIHARNKRITGRTGRFGAH